VVGLDRSTGDLSRAARARQTARGASRAHWLFTLIFAAGLAGRVLAEIAYRPALLYIDSVKYLGGSDHSEPQGYRLLLRLLDREPAGACLLVTLSAVVLRWAHRVPHCCSDCHRRKRSTNSSRICGVRSSGASRPLRLIVSRICARYSVQCGQTAR
jgi:hypothetical protein